MTTFTCYLVVFDNVVMPDNPSDISGVCEVIGANWPEQHGDIAVWEVTREGPVPSISDVTRKTRQAIVDIYSDDPDLPQWLRHFAPDECDAHDEAYEIAWADQAELAADYRQAVR